MIIALGFILRVVIGSVVVGVASSNWIIIMTFLLALFLGFAKRRDDICLEAESGKSPRPVLVGYNVQFIDLAMAIMAAVLIVSYLLFTFSESVLIYYQTNYLYLTSFFVVFGVLRYLQITLVLKKSGSPTKIFLTDPLIVFNVLLWFFSYGLFLYY